MQTEKLKETKTKKRLKKKKKENIKEHNPNWASSKLARNF